MKPRPLPHPGPAPGLRNRRRQAPGFCRAAVQSPPQSARSGQCSSRSRPANCRRNSSSAQWPAGRGRRQGAAAALGLHPSGPPVPHVPSPALSASAPSSPCSRAPRVASSAASRAHSALKSELEGPSAATPGKSSYLWRGRGSRKGRGRSVRISEGKLDPSCTPQPHPAPLTPGPAGPEPQRPPPALLPPPPP